MSGHTVGRRRKWPWAVLSVLFALTLAWSYAVMGEEVGGVWSVLRIGSAVGLGLCLLRLVFVSISSRRLRRAKDDGRRAEGDEGAEAEGQPSGEQPPAEERAHTYEEVFGLHVDPGAEGLPPAPEDGEWPDDERTKIEPDGQPSAEQPAAEEWASTHEDEVVAPHAEVDEDVDQGEAGDADGGSDEHLRRMREEFRARAEEAALRVKQREAELEAASVADQER
jgi:hypothetical protein